MERDAARTCLVEAQGLGQMPRDGFSLAVLIGSQPDNLGFGCKFLEFGYNFLFVVRNYVLRGEPSFYIYAELLFLQIPDMPFACFHSETRPEKPLDGPGFSR